MRIRVKELIWDDFNSSHISQHSVSLQEVEQVCSGAVMAWPGRSGRFLVIGQTKSHRILTIVLALKSEGIFYPVTARTASRKERGWLKK